MGCCNKPAKPFLPVIKMTRQAVEGMTLKGFDLYDIAAIAIKESNGNPFFMPQDLLLKANLNALSVGAGVKADDFLLYVRLRHGPNQGSIPKFRFESVWFKQLHGVDPGHKFSKEKRALLACSIGMCQKSILYLTWGHLDYLDDRHLQQFMSDPFMQLRQCAHDLQSLHAGREVPMDLAFTRYNAGASREHVTEYGKRVEAIAENLRKEYADWAPA